MYEYRQIIVRLRLGESIRKIAKAGIASRSKVKEIHQIAVAQGWLTSNHELPSDERLAALLNLASHSPNTKSSILPYQKQVEAWCRQGIQASTIHATLQRQYGFSGAYDAVQRFVKNIKDKLSIKVTTILEFKPGECAQVDFGTGPTLISIIKFLFSRRWKCTRIYSLNS